jgi:drug/metabolite transporter (DMT)-like permease
MELIILSIFITFLWGFIPIFHKKLLNKISILSIILITSFFYFLFIFIYMIVFQYKTVKNDFNLIYDYKILFIIFLLILFQIIANLIYFHIIQKGLNINVLASITAIQPIITIILTYFILKDDFDKLSIPHIIAISLILTGIFIILYIKK